VLAARRSFAWLLGMGASVGGQISNFPLTVGINAGKRDSRKVQNFAPCGCPFRGAASRLFDFNSAGGGNNRLGLRAGDGEDAVFHIRPDVVGVHIFQHKAALESAASALAADVTAILIGFLVGFVLFGRDGQPVFVQVDLYVLPFEAGHLRVNDVLLGRLPHIHLQCAGAAKAIIPAIAEKIGQKVGRPESHAGGAVWN